MNDYQQLINANENLMVQRDKLRADISELVATLRLAEKHIVDHHVIKKPSLGSCPICKGSPVIAKIEDALNKYKPEGGSDE